MISTFPWSFSSPYFRSFFQTRSSVGASVFAWVFLVARDLPSKMLDKNEN